MYTIGIILGFLYVTKTPFSLAIRLALCAASAYGVHKFIHPGAYIITDFTQWDAAFMASITQGYWFAYVLACAGSWVVFYWLLRLIISATTMKPLGRLYGRFFSHVPVRTIQAVMLKLGKRIFRWIFGLGLLDPNDVDQADITSREWTKTAHDLLAFFSHATVCWWILGLGEYIPVGAWITVVVAMLTFAILIPPALGFLLQAVVRGVVHAAQQVQKQP